MNQFTNTQRRPMRSAIALAAFAATTLTAFGAQAAGHTAWKAERQAIESTYRSELADCQAGRTSEDLKSCRYEARSVRRDALAALHTGQRTAAADAATEPDYHANALLRCEALPADAQDACHRRVDGEGTVVGSVADGIIIRELPDTTAVASAATQPNAEPVLSMAADDGTQNTVTVAGTDVSATSAYTDANSSTSASVASSTSTSTGTSTGNGMGMGAAGGNGMEMSSSDDPGMGSKGESAGSVMPAPDATQPSPIEAAPMLSTEPAPALDMQAPAPAETSAPAPQPSSTAVNTETGSSVFAWMDTQPQRQAD